MSSPPTPTPNSLCIQPYWNSITVAMMSAVPIWLSIPWKSTRTGRNGPAKRKFTSGILKMLMPVEKPEFTVIRNISAK